MLKINTAKGDAMGEAWMLKAKGQGYEAIPVKIHIYGEPGNIDANAEAALWMLKYNPYEKLVDFLRAFVGYIACNEVAYTEDKEEFMNRLRSALNGLPYNLGESLEWSKENTTNYLMGLVEDMSVGDIYDMGDQVDDHSGDFVAKDLNELFIRVRMNDEYNAGVYNGVCYFRIGSTARDWTNQIWAFVYDHGKVKKVVVERDAESDGKEGTNERDVYINNMDRDEFLSAERLPCMASKHADGISNTCFDIISKGKYSDLDAVKANASRIQTICDSLRREHIKLNCKAIVAPWATKPLNR